MWRTEWEGEAVPEARGAGGGARQSTSSIQWNPGAGGRPEAGVMLRSPLGGEEAEKEAGRTVEVLHLPRRLRQRALLEATYLLM